jgi:hypothetical protein
MQFGGLLFVLKKKGLDFLVGEGVVCLFVLAVLEFGLNALCLLYSLLQLGPPVQTDFS